jgi:hypothetical protein
MSGTNHTDQEPYSQLEVVPTERGAHPQLQVLPPGGEPYSKLEVSAESPDVKHMGTSIVTGTSTDIKEQPIISTETGPRRSRRRIWIVWSSVIGVVVVGAVLGGVLGTVLSRHHSSPPVLG